MTKPRAVIPLMLLLMVFWWGNALASPPRIITYQGELRDNAGKVYRTPVSVTFSLYSSLTGGAALWQETRNVTPDGPFFSVDLGAVRPLDLSFDQQYYVGMQVGSDPELAPRMPLSAAPYSQSALIAA